MINMEEKPIIVYRMTGGITRSHHRIEIYKDGKVLAYWRPEDSKHHSILEKELRDILDAIHANNFFSMQRCYCEKSIQDPTTHELTYDYQDRTHTVSVTSGSQPEEFWNIISEMGRLLFR